MTLKANYHTHLALCGHAIGNVEDYAKIAYENGYEVLGISDHGPIQRKDLHEERFLNFGLDLQMDLDDFYTIYLPECRKVQENYKNKLEILIGLEIEYFDEIKDYLYELKENIDYMVLGMHYFPTKDTFHNVYEPMDASLIMDYTMTVVKALDSGLFKIIAHPDIFAMKYKINNQYVFDETCKEASKLIIEAAIRNDVYLEINVGGLRRSTFWDQGIQKYLYPRYDFWKIVEQYPQAKVIIGVDAHEPRNLTDNTIDVALHFEKQFNIKVSEKVIF